MRNFEQRLKGVREAQGAVARGKFIGEGPEVAVQKLGVALTALTDLLGMLLNAFGATHVLTFFADTLGGVASMVEGLIQSVKYLFGLIDRPTFWPKLWAEFKYRMTAERDAFTQEIIVPYETFQYGGQEAVDKALAAHHAKNKKEQDEARDAEKKRRAEAWKQKRATMLKENPTWIIPEEEPDANVPLTAEKPMRPEERREQRLQRREGFPTGGTTAAPGEGQPKLGDAPYIMQRFMSAVADTTEVVSELSDKYERFSHLPMSPNIEDRRGEAPAPAGAGVQTYGALSVGAAEAGAGSTGVGTRNIGVQTSRTQAGTGGAGSGAQTYGGSADARLIRASYRPSGLGAYGGGGGAVGGVPAGMGDSSVAGPAGAGGSGYGSGTTLAPPRGRSSSNITGPTTGPLGGGPPPSGPAARPSGKAGSEEDKAALKTAAADLGVSPQDLATVMLYESAGTMSPGKVGGKGGNYMGLIQFGPAERQKYGVHAGQTFAEQTESARRFLSDRGLKKWLKDNPNATEEEKRTALYSTINAGSPGQQHWGKLDRPGSTVRSHTQQMFAPGSQHVARAKGFLGETQTASLTPPTSDTTATPSNLVPAGTKGQGPTPGQDPSKIPYHTQGTIEMEGKTYRYGSGGTARGATPAGSYPINIAKQYGGKGQLGSWGFWR